MGCGVWGVGCGVWDVECGVWGVGCGVWGVGCGVWVRGGYVKRWEGRCAAKSHDGKGANGSKNRPHNAYPVRCRVSAYYEPCRERARVCQLKKYRQLKNQPSGEGSLRIRCSRRRWKHLGLSYVCHTLNCLVCAKVWTVLCVPHPPVERGKTSAPDL